MRAHVCPHAPDLYPAWLEFHRRDLGIAMTVVPVFDPHIPRDAVKRHTQRIAEWSVGGWGGQAGKERCWVGVGPSTQKRQRK
jgi:hypothetical protein